MGKNLAAFPIIICAGLFWLILINIFLRVPALTTVAAIFQMTAMALIAAMFGNLISICLPYRVRATSLKPTKISGARGVVIVVAQLLFPFLMIPVFIAPSAELLLHLNGMVFPINLALSFIFALLLIATYFWSLPSFGRLLQERETRILETLVTELE